MAALHGFHAALTRARGEVEVLRNEVLPRIQEALRETEYAYTRGRYSYLELVDAQRELLETRVTLIAESAQVHRLRVEIERLTGAPHEFVPGAAAALPNPAVTE